MASSDDTPVTYKALRRPGQYEHRCIARHELGYYGCVVIAGVYSAPTQLPSPLSLGSFLPALKYCIDTHPVLSAAIQGADTETPQYVRPSQLNFRRHVRVLEPSDEIEEEEVTKRAILECHDRFFRHGDLVPPWDVTVVPLASGQEGDSARMLILFSYSHSHGDGTAGLTFHKAFLRGLEQAAAMETPLGDDAFSYTPPEPPLLPAFDQVADMKIAWWYLLAAIVGNRLPAFIGTRLGLQPLSPVTPDTWVGNPMSHDQSTLSTGLDTLVIKGDDLTKLLVACRKQKARLTGLLHQFIVRALRENVSKYITDREDSAPDIVAVTPLNLRHLAPESWTGADSDMVMAVSVTSELFTAASTGQSPPASGAEESTWSNARETGATVAKAASTLTNQPIGLLHYVSGFRAHLAGEVGKERDASYELSNVGVFDPEAGGSSPRSDSPTPRADEEVQGGWEVGRMYFSQPANVVGPPLSFSVVSRKGGDLGVCLSWQVGVLGIGGDEDGFVKEVLESVRSQVDRIVRDI